MNSADSSRGFDRAQRLALGVGVAGLAVCALGSIFNREQFFRSYLVGFLFWNNLALGCLALLMLQHLTGGGWGLVIRRILESGTRTLPLMAVLFVPVLLGLGHLYSWAQPAVVAGDPVLQHKHLYLNPSFFAGRVVFYFLSWLGLAYFLNKWSLQQDQTADPSLLNRFQALSGGGLVLYGLTVTFASVDFVMSLEPHWFSTIYGMIFMVGQALAAMAFVIAVVTLLSDRKPLSDVISASHFHDLGNLTFAFVLLWAYVSFSQYLIIWSGNLKEEIPWYLRRFAGGWGAIGLCLVVFHFALPFLLLLSRDVKRSSRVLVRVALVLILARLIDLLWVVLPAFDPAATRLHWMDFVAPIGIGGIWVAVFVGQLKARPLLPLHDPRLEGAVGDGH